MPSNLPHNLPPQAERRPDRRRRSFLAGRVTFDDGRRVFDCAIRDLTDRGARITIPENQTLPPCFHLISMRERVVHECAVVWMKDGEAGLSFLKTVPLGDLTGSKLDYMRTLWLERAAS
jgi:hypothetical protein